MGTLRGLQMCGRERVRNCCGRDEFYREGLIGLHGFRLDRFCDNTLRYAFSLIELSIVLIIIGLLVAGVTGGKSLIESAKSRALMNEIRGYKQAVNTFYVIHNRYPGDPAKSGFINIKTPSTKISEESFTELFKEGIIDCPIKDTYDINDYCSYEQPSNVYNINYEYATYDVDNKGPGVFDNYDGFYWENYYMPNIPTASYLIFVSKYKELVPVKSIKNIDKKMDDGIYNTGNVLAVNMELCDGDSSYCEGGDILPYDEAIEKKNYRTEEAYFKLDF